MWETILPSAVPALIGVFGTLLGLWLGSRIQLKDSNQARLQARQDSREEALQEKYARYVMLSQKILMAEVRRQKVDDLDRSALFLLEEELSISEWDDLRLKSLKEYMQSVDYRIESGQLDNIPHHPQEMGYLEYMDHLRENSDEASFRKALRESFDPTRRKEL